MYLGYKCGGNITEDKGNLTSPGYPDSTYPNNMECVWTISTTEGTRIAIDLVDFDVQYRYNCYYDYVKVRHEKIIGMFVDFDLYYTDSRYCSYDHVKVQ